MQGTTEPQVGNLISGKLRFRLDRLLGTGGFGSVFQATFLEHKDNPHVPQQVAIKILTGSMKDKHRRHSVQRELSALLAIRCERIPRVYDWELDGSQAFIAMEYFPHGNLEELLVKVGAIDEREALALLESLLTAVIAAHNASILHLDIKPANVLLDGAGGFVLTDFGVSQAPRAGRSLPMPGLGSAGYQAPEQEQRLRGTFDLQTDLFGVGATMWAALTGIDLGSTKGQLMRRRALGSAIVLPPVSMFRKCSGPIEAVVMSLLAREPTSRPGDPNPVLATVRAILDGKEGAELLIPGHPVDVTELNMVIEQIVDPLIAQLFENEHRGIRRLHHGEALCQQDEASYHAFVLIKGAVRILRDGVEVTRVDREGDFLGEIAALTGERRNAAMIAEGDIWVRILNTAQLESVVSANPALGVRLIRSMANRFKYLK